MYFFSSLYEGEQQKVIKESVLIIFFLKKKLFKLTSLWILKDCQESH